jgi:hypothetical protein
MPRSYSLVANQSTLNGRSVWCLAEEPSSRIAQTSSAGHQVQYCTANSTTCDWPQTWPGCGGKCWAVCYSGEAVAPFQCVCRNPRRKLIGLAFGIEISSKDDRILHFRGDDRILRCSEAVNIFGKTAVMPFTTFPYFFFAILLQPLSSCNLPSKSLSLTAIASQRRYIERFGLAARTRSGDAQTWKSCIGCL